VSDTFKFRCVLVDEVLCSGKCVYQAESSHSILSDVGLSFELGVLLR
jgi:hypothetical protein